MKPIWWTSLLVFFLAMIARPSLAQQSDPRPPTDDEVNAIAKQLYCPVCENVPLDVCPTQACAEWRELIREKLAEGWDAEQIKRYFADQYGDRVLAAPPLSGLNWLAYIVPPLSILLGAFLLARAFQTWRRTPLQNAQLPEGASPSDEYTARLEEELRRQEQ